MIGFCRKNLFLFAILMLSCVIISGGCGGSSHSSINDNYDENDIKVWDDDYVEVSTRYDINGSWKIISGELEILAGTVAEFDSSLLDDETFKITLSGDQILLSADNGVNTYGEDLTYIAGVKFMLKDQDAESTMNNMLQWYAAIPMIAGYKGTKLNGNNRYCFSDGNKKTFVYRLQDADTIYYYMHDDVNPEIKKMLRMKFTRKTE